MKLFFTFPVFVMFLIFIIGGFSFFDFNEAFGLSSETIGFPQGSHDQAMWEKNGPMPNNGLGSLDKSMKFVNNDSEIHRIVLGKPYDATYDDYDENSFVKDISPGETFSFTFTKEDTYDWYCEIHPWMTGNVRIGVWKPTFSDIELLGEESFPNHIEWSESRKLTKSDFVQGNPQSANALADIGVEFSFKPNFEYSKHIPCEITIHSNDVITLFSKSRSDWSQSRIDQSVLTDQHVLLHEQKHFDIGEVVARETEDRINEKYVGKPIPCVSQLNNEFKQVAATVEQESSRINSQYDDEVYGGNPTLEQRLQNQANWNVRVDCFLEKRGFDSSCLTLTGTWTQADLKIQIKSSSGTQTTTDTAEPQAIAPKYTPPPEPAPKYESYTQTQKYQSDFYIEGYPGDTLKQVFLNGPKSLSNDGPIQQWNILVDGDAASWVNTNKLDLGVLYPGKSPEKTSWSVKIPDNQKPGRYTFTWEGFCKNVETGTSCKAYLYKYYVSVKSPPSSSVPSYPSSSSLASNFSEKCEGGKIIFDKKSYTTNDSVMITYDVPSSNSDPLTPDKISIRLWGGTNNKGTSATETGPNTGVFKLKNPVPISSMFTESGTIWSEYYLKCDSSWTNDGSSASVMKVRPESVIVEPPTTKKIEKVPNWVKTNAKWWSDGTIKDSDFIQGLQYLIKENLIDVEKQKSEKTTPSKNIPDWVKTQIQWWSNGQISEDEFLNSVEFLMKEGIINIEELTTTDESFLTYTNNDFRFSIDYPPDWFVDDEFTVDENWAGIVWFIPVEGDYSNGISVAMQFEDSEFRGLTSDEYLNQLTMMLEDYCSSATFTYDGFKCKDFEVSDVVYDSDGNHEMYSVMYQTIDVFEDGEEMPRYAIYVEIPRGPDTYILELTTEPFFIDSLSEGEFEELILGTLGSFSYN